MHIEGDILLLFSSKFAFKFNLYLYVLERTNILALNDKAMGELRSAKKAAQENATAASTAIARVAQAEVGLCRLNQVDP